MLYNREKRLAYSEHSFFSRVCVSLTSGSHTIVTPSQLCDLPTIHPSF